MTPKNRVPKNSQLSYPVITSNWCEKHRAIGRFGVKAEWQRKLICRKSKSCGSAHSTQSTPSARRPLVTEEPRKKKVKVHGEPCGNSSENFFPNAPAEEQVSKVSSDLPATTQSPRLLGKWSDSICDSFVYYMRFPNTDQRAESVMA